ncbi:winged helix-turn-helix domain-containing protein [Modestobacter marinus]
MRPLLEAVRDGEHIGGRDLIAAMSDRFELTDEEWTALLPSSRQGWMDIRVGWSMRHFS